MGESIFVRLISRYLMPLLSLFAFGVTSFIVTGCGHQRVLMVRSEPAEAEVCIKGKYKSRYFPTNRKTCIGMTPYEADQVEFVDERGDTRKVDFADLESDKENFYILISKPGYGTRSMQVPSWEHFIALQPDALHQMNVAAQPAVNQADTATPDRTAPSTALPQTAQVTNQNTGASGIAAPAAAPSASGQSNRAPASIETRSLDDSAD